MEIRLTGFQATELRKSEVVLGMMERESLFIKLNKKGTVIAWTSEHPTFAVAITRDGQVYKGDRKAVRDA